VHSSDPSAAVAALAQRQHGVFTRAQAIAAGYSVGAVEGRIRRGRWSVVDHGVYRSAETPTSWHQRLMAACLAGPGLASHRSAAVLWDLPGFTTDVVEVTAVRHRRRKAPDVIWHETIRLGEGDVTEIDTIPATRPTRTILDLGAVVDDAALLRALDDALRRRLTTVARLQAALDDFGDRRRGSGRVRRALALRLAAPVPESVLETEFDELIRRFALPTPSRQWVIRGDGGLAVARVDFAYPAARVAIEIDGARHHLSRDDWTRDMQRQNDITSRGWQVLRFSADDIRSTPEIVKTKILGTLHFGPASPAGHNAGERRNR